MSNYPSLIWHTSVPATETVVEDLFKHPLNHPDIVCVMPEDEKTTIGIQQIRACITRASQNRIAFDRTYVFVFPAASLSLPAAQALLKELEEPRPDTQYILVTHQPYALLPTILSRCIVIQKETKATLQTTISFSPKTYGACIFASDVTAKDREEAIRLLTTFARTNAVLDPRSAKHALDASRKLQENCNAKLTLDQFFFSLHRAMMDASVDREKPKS